MQLHNARLTSFDVWYGARESCTGALSSGDDLLRCAITSAEARRGDFEVAKKKAAKKKKR